MNTTSVDSVADLRERVGESSTTGTRQNARMMSGNESVGNRTLSDDETIEDFCSIDANTKLDKDSGGVKDVAEVTIEDSFSHQNTIRDDPPNEEEDGDTVSLNKHYNGLFSYHGRSEQLKKSISFYQKRLTINPESSNTSLWKLEIKELKKELEVVESDLDLKASSIETQKSIDRRTAMRNTILYLWNQTKYQDPDSLVKRNFINNVNVDDQSQNDPFTVLNESSKLLQNTLTELDSLSEELKLVGKGTLTDISAQMLREIIDLRLQLNKYQDEIISRTAQKAERFNQTFEHGEMIRNKGAQESGSGWWT